VAERMDYEASCRRLSFESPPPIPERRPRYDDEEPFGVHFFRTFVEGDYSGLTLTRTFFGRSEIKGATFFNTDLRESTLCWNDFIEVDFRETDLSQSDLRASLFEDVSFVGANLQDADLRRSTFINCQFDRASMKGATLSRSQGLDLPLSAAQRAEIHWVDEDGDEPDGG